MNAAIGAVPETAVVAQPGALSRHALTVEDLFTLLTRRWRYLAKAAVLGAAVGLALAFLLPVRYTAITTILPPAPSGSIASAFAQAGELGALAGLAGNSFGFHNPADLCLLMLRSRSVEDAVIQRFNLMSEYDKKRLSDTRTALERRTQVSLNLKSGLIAISAQDHDAARAAELANGYVDEFKKFTASLAITEASQRRVFFEQQLLQARGSLTEAEEALKMTQQDTGMLDPAGASKASLESAVAVRAQITAKQVQLRTMRTYATDENPEMIQVKQEIAALDVQLAELTGTGRDAAADPLVPKGRIPQAGAEYLRRLRDVKYNESVVAILARQLEIARLDEARQGAAVQVVDPAVTPDKRSFPKRTVTLLACTMLAFCSACLWAIYGMRDTNRAGIGMQGNAIAMILMMAASAHCLTAQSSESRTLTTDCANTDNAAMETSCAEQQQKTAAPFILPAGAEQRPEIYTNGESATRERGADRASANERARSRPPLTAMPPEPQTEFEQMAADSAGGPLAVFGHSFFDQPPSTFAPGGEAQVPSDYVIGPGDELRIRIWGQIDADLRIEVDRSGDIFIPSVGEVPVAGLLYRDLEGAVRRAIERVYKSFSLAVAIGRLHSIQVFVVGQAKAPGVYTISSLSTLVNAVFASGGPSHQGSLRRIQLRRGDRTVQEFDLYDLLIKGDKSRDAGLQSGDVVFIPPVGALAAIAGSVNSPGIYELRDGMTLGALIETAGGLSTLADGNSVSVERIREHESRTVIQSPLDRSGLAFALEGGDVVRISSIVPRFDDTVTLRGYVSSPGRYPFVAGMHVRDLLPNGKALLPREYWLTLAGTTDARQTGYPVRKQVPTAPQSVNPAAPELRSSAAAAAEKAQPDAAAQAGNETRQQTTSEYYRDLARAEAVGGEDGERTAPESGEKRGEADMLTRDLRKLVPSVNWRYALIQRMDAATLKTKLISFDLGKAIVDNDPASNLALEPGDIVTILSQQEITAPIQSQTRYVKVEGEVEHPGVYELTEGQTLRELLETAGGLTAKAYPYAARLTRESARIEQQRGLDEMVRTAEAEMRSSTVTAVASATQDSGAVAARQAAQQNLLASLRSAQASGRVVLAMRPDAAGTSDFPSVALEDGDRIVIPARTSTVTVSGAVYNPASFVYDARRKVGDYLEMAGKGGLNSNQRRAFVLRADGTVISRQEAGGLLHGGFERLPMHPGDQIVVPERVDNGVVRALHDWPQILAPLALTALAFSTVVQ
jgi:protein involved in polysaccharide export with SLBB domain/uncharacterized protein involved in exopolysaccharide biosynthesis